MSKTAEFSGRVEELLRRNKMRHNKENLATARRAVEWTYIYETLGARGLGVKSEQDENEVMYKVFDLETGLDFTVPMTEKKFVEWFRANRVVSWSCTCGNHGIGLEVILGTVGSTMTCCQCKQQVRID